MSWIRKLFGLQAQPGEQDKTKIPPSESASIVTASADFIGVRFDIGKIDSGGYGEECWKVFWRAVNTEIVAGSQLLEGDTNDTLHHRENVYCLAVKWMFGSGRGNEVLEALEHSEEYDRIAAHPHFINAVHVTREPLVDAGTVDRSGNIVGTSYRALPALEQVLKEKSRG